MSYHAPTELDDALAILARGDVAVIAGGTDHFPARRRGGEPRAVLDLTRIAPMQGIARTADGWRIGGAVRWSEIADAPLPAAFAGLQDAARQVGSLQIQNAGTVAGNICNASPAADGVPPLLTLDASVRLAGPDGARRMPLAEFLTGVRQTALRPGELLVEITLPAPPEGTRGAFCKLGSRRYLVISICMSSVLVGLDDDGRIVLARVAVGACSPVACRLPQLEAALIGQRPEQVTVSESDLSPLSPIDDVRGTATYRRAAVAHQIGQALANAAGGADG